MKDLGKHILGQAKARGVFGDELSVGDRRHALSQRHRQPRVGDRGALLAKGFREVAESLCLPHKCCDVRDALVWPIGARH